MKILKARTKKRKTLFTLFLYISATIAYAQEGNVFLQNYSPGLKEADSKNLAITQGGNGVMYFANSRGILAYDGVRWKHITTPGTPYAFGTDTASGKIYVGCKGNFGYLEIEETGVEVYKSISDDDEFGVITQIAIAGGNVFFYSTGRLYRYEIEEEDIKESWTPQEGDVFGGLVVHNEQVYVNTVQGGLQQLGDEVLKPLSNGKQFASMQIVASIDLGEGKTLICASGNKTYSFNGKTFKPFYLEASDYLKETHIVSGIRIAESIIALGTLTGGCVLVDTKTGKTKNIINYQTGLPDDEVFALGKDNIGGLWITHEYGITRADFELPVTNLSAYNGLQGNLVSAAESNGKVYAATTVGVFQLAKLSTSEVAKYTRKSSKSKRKVEKFFSNLFGGKKKRKGSGSAVQASFYALQSVRYGYKQVSGIDEKCRELLPYKGMVLAATINGLYSINSLYASPVIKDTYIHFVYHSQHHDNLFYVGTDKGLVTLHYSSGWRTDKDVKGVDRAIYSITEGGKNHLWLGGENEVIKVAVKRDGTLGSHQAYPIEANFTDEIMVRSILGMPMFFSHDGIYKYSESDDEVMVDEELNENFKSVKMVFSQDGHAWLYNGFKWRGYSEGKDGRQKEAIYLNVVDNIQYIFSDKKNNCWVVDNSNGFYRIDGNAKRRKEKSFLLSTREAVGETGKLLELGDLKLTHDNSAVRFTFSSPYYINEHGTEYQYFLDGVMDDWSEWGDNAIIDFPYLPEGVYELHTRAKNVFGEIIEGKIIEINVVPPYYHRWWFYLLELLFVSSLLVASILLNANEESTIFSKTLAFLTFIFIYKLLTTIVKYTFGASFLFDLFAAIIIGISVHKIEHAIMHYAKTEDARRRKKQIALWWHGKIMKQYAPVVKKAFRKK